MPAGGHVDDNETPEETAKRECKEETGLDVEIIGSEQPDLFERNTHEGTMLKKPIAMMLEEIPARPERNEPAHQHMDFLFIAKLMDETQVLTLAEEEATEMRWFTKEEVAALDSKKEIFGNVQRYILEAL